MLQMAVRFTGHVTLLGPRNLRLFLVYTITFITMFVPAYSVWYVILFRETGVSPKHTYI
jgi:hypothetical protein